MLLTGVGSTASRHCVADISSHRDEEEVNAHRFLGCEGEFRFASYVCHLIYEGDDHLGLQSRSADPCRILSSPEASIIAQMSDFRQRDARMSHRMHTRAARSHPSLNLSIAPEDRDPTHTGYVRA